jgi:hypothetical protein
MINWMTSRLPEWRGYLIVGVAGTDVTAAVYL